MQKLLLEEQIKEEQELKKGNKKSPKKEDEEQGDPLINSVKSKLRYISPIDGSTLNAKDLGIVDVPSTQKKPIHVITDQENQLSR